MHNGFTHVHAHTQRVHEWPLIGWKNARNRVCRRRVCQVMVSTSFYELALWLFACTTSAVRKRSRALCGACKRTHTHTHTHTRAYARYFVNARNRDSIGSGAAANNYTCPIRHAKLLLDSRGRLERAAGTSDDLEISSRN